MKEISPLKTYSEWRQDPEIPYKIHCTFNMPDTKLLGEISLDQRHPAHTLLTPDLFEPGYSVSMYFHLSIPLEFLEFVYYHEKVEAAAMFGDKHLPPNQAHQLAIEATDKHILETHGQETLNKFKKWYTSLQSK